MVKLVMDRRLGLLVLAACVGAFCTRLLAQSAPSPSLPANWQQLGQGDFASLCETWIGVTDVASQTDKTTLATYAWSTWLDDQAKAGGLSVDQFIALSTLAAAKLSNDDCHILANVMLRRFPANTDVQPLSLTSLDRLSGPVASRLGFTADQVSGWLGSWVDGHKGGADLSLADTAQTWDICHKHLASSSPVFQSLSQSMWDNSLKTPAGWTAVGDADVMGYYNRLAGFLPKADTATLCKNVWARLNSDPAQIAQQMVMRNFRKMFEEIIPNANVPMKDLVPLAASFITAKSGQCTLSDLSYAVFIGSMFRHDEQLEGTVTTIYQAAATATVNQLSQNMPITDFDDNYDSCFLGRVFEADSDRQQLTNLLSSTVLENRLAAAQILTWSYYYAGKTDDWQTQVAAKAAAPQADADTKAFWLLVSGDASVVKYWPMDPNSSWEGNSHHDPQVWRRHQWLDKAFAAAQSEPMRILILEQYTSYFKAMGRPEHAASLLASVVGQFTPASATKIKSLQQSCENQRNYLDAITQQQQAEGLKASQQLQLQYLEVSLQRSQMAKDQRAVARLQTAISSLQAQIQSPAQPSQAGQ